jgi:RNA polymerase sigma factor (sigma-70 family)
MNRARVNVLVRYVRQLQGEATETPTDRELLSRYSSQGDEDAFESLVQRHGPLVWSVCRRALGHQDAEDVFQATFMVLARKAGSVHWQESVGPWLHAAAVRLARKVRTEARCGQAVGEIASSQPDPLEAMTARELLTALDEELAALPEKYRGPLVLCLLQGKTQPEAARLLGTSLSSVRRHLEQGRERLHLRLTRRGLSLSTACAVALTHSPASAAPGVVLPLAAHTTTASARAAALAELALEVTSAKLKAVLAVLLVMAAAVVGVGLAACLPTSVPPNPAAPHEEPPPDPGAGQADHLDAHGDPLPPDALARLGTVRLRPGGPVCGLAFSTDGRALATIGSDFNLCMWQIPSGRLLARLPRQSGSCNALAFSRDGKSLAASGPGGDIAVYDFGAAQPGAPGRALLEKERSRIRDHNYFLAFLPDGNLLSASVNGQVSLRDAAGKEVRRFGNLVERVVHAFALSPDGARLAVGGKADVVVWNVDRGVPQATLTGHDQVSSIVFAPDGKTLASGDSSNTIRLWDVEARKVTARLVGKKAPGQASGHGDVIRSLVFTPDGKTLISVGDHCDGTIRLWDVGSGKERLRLKGQHGDGNLLALAPDGKTLAVTGHNNTVHLWDVTAGQELDRDLGSQGATCAVAIAPDGKEVATGGSDGVIRCWERDTGKERRSFRAHLQHIKALAYSPDGSRLMSASGSGEPARLWDVASGREIRSFAGLTARSPSVHHFSYSLDGKRLALSAHDPDFPMKDTLIQLVDVNSGKIERTVAQGLPQELALSTDGRLLAGGALDGKVRLWDLTAEKETWSFANLNAIACVSFSPDGKQVAAGTYHDNEVVLLEALTGKEVRRLKHPSSTVRAVAISPDGRLLAASGDTADVILYELDTGLLVQRLAGHAAGVGALAFAPDGRSLVSGSADGTALVWDLTGQEQAKKQPGPLTVAELAAHWALLGDPKSADAHRAVLALANAPKQGAPFLRTRLAESPPPDPKAVAKWLAELDHDEFDKRQTAARELARCGKSVEAELRRARLETPSAEVRRRLDELLEKLAAQKMDERLRAQRVVAILELIATEEARELLADLAREAGTEDLRRRSESALQRLARRP